MRPILERCAEVGATIAREGSEFGVLRRTLAVGGQVLTLQGLGGVYDEIFLPLHGAHQAQNAAVALAAVEAFLGAGAAPPARRRAGPGGLRRRRPRPGRLERVRTAPTILLDGAHNPHGMAATVAALQEEFAFSRLIAVVGGARRQGRRRPAGAAGAGRRRASWCTRNSSPRAMPAEELGRARRRDLRRRTGSTSRRRLPDAIETAVPWPSPTWRVSSAGWAC